MFGPPSHEEHRSDDDHRDKQVPPVTRPLDRSRILFSTIRRQTRTLNGSATHSVAPEGMLVAMPDLLPRKMYAAVRGFIVIALPANTPSSLPECVCRNRSALPCAAASR